MPFVIFVREQEDAKPQITMIDPQPVLRARCVKGLSTQ